MKAEILVVYPWLDTIRPIIKFLRQQSFIVHPILTASDLETSPYLATSQVYLVGVTMMFSNDIPVYQWLFSECSGEIIGLSERAHLKQVTELTASKLLYDYLLIRPIYDIHQYGFTVSRALEKLRLQKVVRQTIQDMESLREEIIPQCLEETKARMWTALEEKLHAFRNHIVDERSNQIVQVKQPQQFNQLYTKEHISGIGEAIESLKSEVYTDIYSEVEHVQSNFRESMGYLHTEEQSQQSSQEQSVKILVVDDEFEYRDLLAEYLEMQGYQIITEASGQAAFAAAKKKQPDVIIMDIAMPGLTGLDASILLRDDPMTQDIPIMLISAKSNIENVQMSQQLHIEDFIAKPFDFPDLLKRLSQVLTANA